MDLWNPLDQLETAFYCRQSSSSNEFRSEDAYSYHNLILIGCNIWLVQKKLKPHDVGKFRLVLIQGTRNGRLRGMNLNMDSELHGSVLSNTSLEGVPSSSAKYMIEITGINHINGQESIWQLITLNEEVFNIWMEKLKKAKSSLDILEASGEAEKLRQLAKRMREGMVIRQHLSRFRFYARTFLSTQAIAFLMKDCICTESQACNIANRLLNMGLIHHVTYEHLFCQVKLLYRFSNEIDPIIKEASMNDLADENHRLLASYHTSQQEMVHLRGHLATLYTSLRSVTQGIETSLQEVEMTATTTLTRLLAVFLVLFVLVCGLWLSIENPHPTGSGGTLNFYQSFFFLSASLIIFLTIIALRKVHKYPQKYNQQYMRTMQVLGEVQGLLAKEAELGDLPGGLEDIEDYEDDSDEDEEGATNSGSARVPPAGVGAALGDITRGRSDSDSSCSSTHSHAPVAGAHHHTSILAQLPGPAPPILVVRSSSMVPAWLSDAEKAKMLQPLAIAPHAVWDIDNELFSGRIYMLFDGIQGADREFFREKKRKFQSIVQGRFKRSLSYAAIYTGQAYDSKPLRTPARWLISAITAIMPGMQMNTACDMPYMMSPLIASAQNVCISLPGSEPDIEEDIDEDLSLLKDLPVMTNKKRRNYFSKRVNLLRYTYDPLYVYTFDFFENAFNFSTFQLEFGFLKYNVLKLLGTMPVQIMAVHWDPVEHHGAPPTAWKFLYNFEVYHQRMLASKATEKADSGEEHEDMLDHTPAPPEKRHSFTAHLFNTSPRTSDDMAKDDEIGPPKRRRSWLRTKST